MTCKTCKTKTCETCYHCEICNHWDYYNDCPYDEGNSDGCNDFSHYVDESKIVELPCRVGQTVYVVDNNLPKTFLGIEMAVCCGFEIMSNNENRYYIKNSAWNNKTFRESDIGLSIFFTKEKAEAKLKELYNDKL